MQSIGVANIVDTLLPRIRTRLRANRIGHTLPDNHGQIWMELATLAEQDETLFQGTSTEVKKEMLQTLGLSSCFWFDPLDEVLKKISKLSRGLDEAVHLSDWAALVRLLQLCSSANTHKLFYPDAPNDVLADLSDQGHLYRQSGLLVGLEHGHYHNAARYLISHVTQWINCEPTKVIDCENNKPQLWRDFIPALTIEHDRRAPRKSRNLQREIFACAEGRIDQLKGSLGGDISNDTYMERFRSLA
ncbi:hypothetical protein ACLOAV_005921 [Pseudogymnoascus australis]